jgi:hypothetical protein
MHVFNFIHHYWYLLCSLGTVLMFSYHDSTGSIPRHLRPWPSKFGRFLYQSFAVGSPSLSGPYHRIR